MNTQPSEENITSSLQDMVIAAARYHQAMLILERYGIRLQAKDGFFKGDRSGYPHHRDPVTFPEALDKAIRAKLLEFTNEIRDLEYEVRDLKRQLPKVKEVELNDGSTMHIMDDN
ncbi:MAG: hypothetical protein AAFV93_22515 [Chloroflexota bacterium]